MEHGRGYPGTEQRPVQNGAGDSAPLRARVRTRRTLCVRVDSCRGVLLEETSRVLQPWKWTSKGMKTRGAGWPSAMDREAH